MGTGIGYWVDGWVFGDCEVVGEEENIYSSVKICVSTEITRIVKLPGRCLTTTTVKRNDDQDGFWFIGCKLIISDQ